MIRYSTANDTSVTEAMKIIGARSEYEGIDAEYKMIERIFNILKLEWTVLWQELIKNNNRYYDRLVLQDENGKVSEIWFEVTEFLRK